MSDSLLELRNPDHWEQAYSVTLTAEPVTRIRGGYRPIPAFQIPLLFSSPILMTDTLSSDAAESWWLGGTLRMKVDGPFIGSADLFAQRRKVPINRTTLIRFPRLTAQYNLEFATVPWLREVRLQILEYTGPITSDLSDVIERTDVLRVDIARLETKIDAMRNGTA